jgi:3-isopropylmalate/(R)-2-methylmalate dehydratase small subunit
MKLKGKVHKYGSNVNTDEIIPARYLNVSDPDLLAQHCMEDIDESFIGKVKKGDVIVAENNFGCGSSREHAPATIKASGISAVIANSFARIFFRNSINIGLPIIESPEAVSGLSKGDRVEIDLTAGKIKNLTKSKTYKIHSFPKFMRGIIEAGGLMEYSKETPKTAPTPVTPTPTSKTKSKKSRT